MISDQVLRTTIKGIQDTTLVDLCMLDEMGATMIATFRPDVDFLNKVVAFIDSKEGATSKEDICFVRRNHISSGKAFILSVRKGQSHLDEEALMSVAKLASFQLSQLMEAYDSKTAESDLIGNLLLSDFPPVNLESSARELGLDYDVIRAVLILESSTSRSMHCNDKLKELLISDKVLIISLRSNYSIIILEVDDIEEVDKKARTIYEALNQEIKLVERISYGLMAENLLELKAAYEQAKVAIEVSKMFYPERMVNSFTSLGLGRLIYDLDIDVCEKFLKEHFEKKAIESLDKDMLDTINAFFENNLNISETARQMFIHRNTLIYRLNKFYNITGLDVRKLDDAITFKVSVMAYKKSQAG